MEKTFPEVLEQYKRDAFWDTVIVDRPSLHRDFVIERLLQYGGMGGIRWLLQNCEHAAIKNG